MRIEGKKTLVTGAGGFIGSHLVEVLVRMGAKVSVFVRYNSRSDLGLMERLPQEIKGEIEVFAGDLKDPEALRRPVKRSELVMHLGSLIAIPYSYINPMDFVQTNVVGTANFLNVCMGSGMEKIVHTSTSEVYGTATYSPIDEDHPLQAQSPYSATKIAADKLVESYYRSFGLPVAIARPFNTYGPWQSARAVIPTIILQALHGDRVMLGSLNPTRDLTFVEDTVSGLIEVAKSERSIGEVVNIGSGNEVSIGGLAHSISSMMGQEIQILKDERRVRPDKSEVERLVCDNSKAKKLLGWEPRVSLEEGLRRTIDWFRSKVGEHRTTYAI
ncbi:MAG: SDR family NAD(P)-dependent oxidoreductase [Thermodesulfobacteriota bacterium]|nr:SDR family NAD(P)-dependent oxidoreductase [Thermodesulfobacteriota bacterium]